MIILPEMMPGQEQSWLALLEASARLDHQGWCLVGGQMVHLHCYERGSRPNRATNDGDVALDVRGDPNALMSFTSILKDMGFTADGTTIEGHQHRWIRDAAKIDVLIPAGVGMTAASRAGAAGGTTLQSPGLQQALDRAEIVEVQVAGTVGRLPRPNLVGAIVVKAAAYTVTNDSARQRHLLDLAVLATLITARDHLRHTLGPRDRSHLRKALAAMDQLRPSWTGIEGSEEGFVRLRAAVGGEPGRRR